MAVQVREETLRQFYNTCYTNGYQINVEVGSGSYGKVFNAVAFRDIIDSNTKTVKVKRETKCAIKLAIKKPGCERVQKQNKTKRQNFINRFHSHSHFFTLFF